MNKLLSQDLVFSNSFSSAIFSNAAFTGAAFDTSNYNSNKFQMSYRNQRIGQSMNIFQSNFLSYDQTIKSSYGNIGAYFISDRLGVNGLIQSSQMNITYSYYTPFSKKGLTARYGLSVGLKNQGVDIGKLKFEDQIDYRVGITRNSNEFISGNNLTRVDLNAGILLHNHQSYIGFSIHNLTKPKFDYIGKNDNSIMRRYTFQVGNSIKLIGQKSSILPSVTVIKQDIYTQSNLSISLKLNSLSFGGGIRSTSNNHSSISTSNFFIGMHNKKYWIRYLYETNLLLSSLYAAPTHEMSIVFNFNGKSTLDNSNIFLMSY